MYEKEEKKLEREKERRRGVESQPETVREHQVRETRRERWKKKR